MNKVIEFLTSIKSNSSSICIPKLSRKELLLINSTLFSYINDHLIEEMSNDYKLEAKILDPKNTTDNYVEMKKDEARFLVLSNLSLLIASNKIKFDFSEFVKNKIKLNETYTKNLISRHKRLQKKYDN